MFTYVALIKLTPEGRESLKEAPEYLDKIKFFVEEQKGKLVTTFAMMGPWDFFAIVEYPTVEAAFKAHAKVATLEVIEVETFPVEEVELFIKALA
ncbi:MAG TPA: GYD domain-containing protein [Gaiellaceae bacterium]